jgi:hypothetical protein
VETETGTAAAEVIPAVPVQVGHDLNVQGQAADYGAWMTYLTPAGADQARPILPFEPARHRATIVVSALTSGPVPGQPSQLFEGATGVGPGAGTTIVATGVLPQGTYTVTPVVMMTGTVTFADAMNVALKVGATVTGVIPVAGAAENIFPPVPVTVVVPAGGAVISLATIGVGSGTASTIGQLNVILQPAAAAAAGVWAGTQAQCQASPPLGGFLPAGQYVIENNQALWLTGDGANAMRVAVLQERWDSGQGAPR